MKKQMILAALLCAAAMAARAADSSYLYWMVDLGESSEYKFSYATIKATGTDGKTSDYLSLYTSGSSDSVGTKLSASTYPDSNGTTTGYGAFTGVTGYGSGSTFLVELWASGAASDGSDATRVAWGSLAYSTVANYIYTNMGQAGASPYTVTASQVVPEPTSGLLALLGLAALALRRKQTGVAFA